LREARGTENLKVGKRWGLSNNHPPKVKGSHQEVLLLNLNFLKGLPLRKEKKKKEVFGRGGKKDTWIPKCDKATFKKGGGRLFYYLIAPQHNNGKI